MVEVVALCLPLLILGGGMPSRLDKMTVKPKKDRHCHYAQAILNSKQQPEKNHKKPLTLNLTSTFDSPLYESPEVSFDQFLEDEQRVIKALFPYINDHQPSKKEWRIQMPKMEVLFLSFCFTVYIKLRYKSMGKDYPPSVPHHIPKIIELELTRWELGGLAEEYHPRDFCVSLTGTIYPDRKQGTQSKLRSQYDLNMSFVVSPLLGWVPDSVMHSLLEALTKTVMLDSASNARLLEHYDEFKTEKLKNVARD